MLSRINFRNYLTSSAIPATNSRLEAKGWRIPRYFMRVFVVMAR